jgi:hypothetical protein
MAKRAINEQDKINFAKGHKFSSEYQPDPKNKSNGKLLANRRNRAIKEIADAVVNGDLPEAFKKSAEAWNLPNDTIIDGLFLRLVALAFSKEAKPRDVEAAIRVLAEFTGQSPAIKVAQTDSEGNDIPVNDLSKVPTETLLAMAERVEEKIDE